MNFWKWLFSRKEDATKAEPVPGAQAPAARKKALCVGINDYPGTRNDLQGCVNDAKSWADLLKGTFGFTSVKMLLNSQATAKNVANELSAMLRGSVEGDIVVFTYSGHGTSVPDKDGDEPDGRDEAICCYDALLIDDQLRGILASTPKGVSVTIISDSCHSGSVTRSMLARGNDVVVDKPRFMPPEDGVFPKALSAYPVSSRAFIGEDSMVEVLLTGCQSDQYSFDAFIGGRYMGAMSASAIPLMRQHPEDTWQDFYQRLRKQLPSSKYNQAPQLEGSKGSKAKKLFT